MKIRNNKKRIGLFLKSIFLLMHLMPTASNSWPSPDTAINEFIAFETSGGRTKSFLFHKYLAVESDYDEPGWDTVEIVDSYSIGKIICENNKKCKVTVKFQLTPTENIQSDQILNHPHGGEIYLTYIIVKEKNEWLLADSNAHPKITLAAFKKISHQ